MERKQKIILAGVIGGVLALIAIYVNFFAGATPRDDLQEAARIAQEVEAERQAEPVTPVQTIAPDQPKASIGKHPQNPF